MQDALLKAKEEAQEKAKKDIEDFKALGKLVTKSDKKRQKVTKSAPIFCHSLPYNSVFVNCDKNRQKLDFVASILSMLTKSDKTII